MRAQFGDFAHRTGFSGGPGIADLGSEQLHGLVLTEEVQAEQLRAAVHSQPGELVATGDDDKAALAGGQQRPYLLLVAGVVQHDQDLPVRQQAAVQEALDRWIPVNLRDVSDLGAVATIALDEGLPLTWVPRTEIVLQFIDAENPEARIGILADRRADVLDDCEQALASSTHEWATECRNAIAAMRAGLDGPAQSHASNIIDSIVLCMYGRNGRNHVRQSAQVNFDGQPLPLAAENLTLRPLFRVFTTWFPNTGVNPPDYFARHATSHAVGHVGVFAPVSALVAVMLATSLTVEYAAEEQGIDASDSETAA